MASYPTRARIDSDFVRLTQQELADIIGSALGPKLGVEQGVTVHAITWDRDFASNTVLATIEFSKNPVPPPIELSLVDP